MKKERERERVYPGILVAEEEKIYIIIIDKRTPPLMGDHCLFINKIVPAVQRIIMNLLQI